MSKREPIAVLSGTRTPMGKAFTELGNVSAVDLGVHAVSSVTKQVVEMGDASDSIDVNQVIMGNVASPPDAANIARVIAMKSGMPKSCIAHTVNRNCASGMESIIAAWDAVQRNGKLMVVCGGTESMTQIPMFLRPAAARLWMQMARSKTFAAKLSTAAKFRPRHFMPVAGVQMGLTDPVCGLNMGETAEVLAKEFGISREQQDQFATESHRRAAAARQRCFLSGEITPITCDRQEISKDNAPRENQSVEQLARLRPIFDSAGTVTAGNSCPLTDGAAALVISDVTTAERFDKPLGYITDFAVSGCDPHRMGLGPVYATAKLFQESKWSMKDMDLIELNEAFAAQVLACDDAFQSKSFAENELGLSQPIGELRRERLNIHGGAIALGHPVGMTGTRLILTLLRALREKGLRRGLATLCVGGGQGVAMVVQTELED